MAACSALEEFPPGHEDVLGCSERYPSVRAAEEDTVWIGFMDIVPVIGTLKEAVELVMAVYEGNEAVIKEKEKAIENIMLTLLDKPAAAAISGNENVTAVRKGMITECVKQGSKGGTKPQTSAQQKERLKRVEAIKQDMLKKIHLIKPNFICELKEELQRSKRGEHVFNNGILKFHSKVLTDFIQRQNIYNLRGYNQHQKALNALGSHTLSQKTAEEIETKMVVDFDEDEFYVNANAVVYGVFCSVLHDDLLAVLYYIKPNDVTKEKRQRVNYVIDVMNKYQIYVDEMAKDKWINKETRQERQTEQTRLTRFERVRQEVANMYKTDRGLDWCRRILEVVAPLFGLRQ